MIFLRGDFEKLQLFTWLPAIAFRPSLLQSSSSCISIVMRGTRIIVMEPVTYMNSLGFQDLTSSTLRQEVTEQQHRQSLAKPRWKGTEDVVWLVLAEGAFQDVQLKTLRSAGCLVLIAWKGQGLTWKSLSWGKAGWASLRLERALSRAPLRLSIAEIQIIFPVFTFRPVILISWYINISQCFNLTAYMVYLLTKIFSGLRDGRLTCIIYRQGWKPKYLIIFCLVLDHKELLRSSQINRFPENVQLPRFSADTLTRFQSWVFFFTWFFRKLPTNLQLTDLIWFGVTYAMSFSELLLFSKLRNFLIATGQTSTYEWWGRPAASNTLYHHHPPVQQY